MSLLVIYHYGYVILNKILIIMGTLSKKDFKHENG